MSEDKKTYYGLAIDPLHVGAGGYRLGRVDNTIIRDPGTDLPKIPGSSISGVCRNYAIYGLEESEKTAAKNCAMHKNPKIINNCGKCIICKSFGFASGEDKKNQMGLIKFFDGSIIAFPVATMCGPVWVTSPVILKDLGVDNPPEPENEELITTFQPPGSKLNLGWLYLNCKQENVSLPTEIPSTEPAKHILEKLVIAPDYLFPEIVNANLEVRTSVSIDFETGAAKSGALFTYEAIPRTTLTAFDVVVDAYRCNNGISAEKVWEIVGLGLNKFEILGLGGMNTRGFGRLKIINI